ncbi:MAG: hypothetical protein ABIQ53_12295 [Terracoccus sp.]
MSRPPGQCALPFDVSDRHLGFDTYDLATQRGTSPHHMAELAGLRLEQRFADWGGAPFTSDSESHVSVWRKPER